jgi:hypothetical protein
MCSYAPSCWVQQNESICQMATTTGILKEFLGDTIIPKELWRRIPLNQQHPWRVYEFFLKNANIDKLLKNTKRQKLKCLPQHRCGIFYERLSKDSPKGLCRFSSRHKNNSIIFCACLVVVYSFRYGTHYFLFGQDFRTVALMYYAL